MLDAGIFRMEEYVERGWVTALKYEDEILKDLEQRTDSKPDKLKTAREAPCLPNFVHLETKETLSTLQ